MLIVPPTFKSSKVASMMPPQNGPPTSSMHICSLSMIENMGVVFLWAYM